MKITIAGAGVAGSYLSRLLYGRYDMEVYDANAKRGCQCAWGSIQSHLDGKLRKVGLSLSDYVLCTPTFAYVNRVNCEVRDLVVFDKRRFLAELTEGIAVAPINLSLEPRLDSVLVNATATPLQMPSLAMQSSTSSYTIQWKMRLANGEKNACYVWIDLRRLGYGWGFPLDEEGKVFHVGAGTVCSYAESAALTHEMLRIYDLGIEKVYCACSRPLLTGRFPLVLGNETFPKGTVVSLGEAAGCVFPLGGEGIIPSIESAEFLAESLEDGSLDRYVLRLGELLENYRDTYAALETLKTHRLLGVVKAVRAAGKRAKMQARPTLNWKNKLRLLTRLALSPLDFR